MPNFSACVPGCGVFSLFSNSKKEITARHGRNAHNWWLFLAGLILFSSMAVAQNTPQVTGVDPTEGKVNDTITVSGSNLGKGSVSSVYLSDDKNDYKATIVDQTDDKISVKVPQVKAGDYNVSIQVGEKIFIKPVRFKVD